MNTKFTIKNFRVFDENGVQIEFLPITILTGRNSAGKSSIVKAIAVLNSFLEQIRRDKENRRRIVFSKYRIKFDELFNRTMGNFESVLHRGTEEHCITLEYTIHSSMLFEDVRVSFSFKDEDEGKDEHFMHYGVLCKFCVKTLEGEEIYYSSNNGYFCYNLNLIKEKFCDFALGEFYANSFMGLYTYNVPRDEIKEIRQMAKSFYDEMDDVQREDISNYLRDPFNFREPIILNPSKNSKTIEAIKNEGCYFPLPVIDECLSGLSPKDVNTKVEEILSSDEILEKKSKDLVIRFVKEITERNINIGDYWKEQEKMFLGSVQDSSLVEMFLSSNGNAVVFPYESELNIGQDFRIINENAPFEKFYDKYEVLMNLDRAYRRWRKGKDPNYSQDVFYTYIDDEIDYRGLFEHPSYRMLCRYASRVIENVLFPEWSEKFTYIYSTRALPRRLYTPDSDNVFYNTLSEYLTAKSEYENYLTYSSGSKKKNYEINKFINYWIGKEGFDFAKAISVESVMGAAIVVKLIKEDGSEVFLTDEGYGLTQLVSILISIETAILKARGIKYENYPYQSELDGLDTGVFYYEQQTIAVEEPEIHLHPEFQSKLANMFVSALEYNIHFIVETHSEYLIRKSQVLVAKMGFTSNKEAEEKCPFQTYYIPLIEKPYPLGYRKDGKFKEDFGSGFYDEASNLAFDIL